MSENQSKQIIVYKQRNKYCSWCGVELDNCDRVYGNVMGLEDYCVQCGGNEKECRTKVIIRPYYGQYAFEKREINGNSIYQLLSVYNASFGNAASGAIEKHLSKSIKLIEYCFCHNFGTCRICSVPFLPHVIKI